MSVGLGLRAARRGHEDGPRARKGHSRVIPYSQCQARSEGTPDPVEPSCKRQAMQTCAERVRPRMRADAGGRGGCGACAKREHESTTHVLNVCTKGEYWRVNRPLHVRPSSSGRGARRARAPPRHCAALSRCFAWPRCVASTWRQRLGVATTPGWAWLTPPSFGSPEHSCLNLQREGPSPSTLSALALGSPRSHNKQTKSYPPRNPVISSVTFAAVLAASSAIFGGANVFP